MHDILFVYVNKKKKSKSKKEGEEAVTDNARRGNGDVGATTTAVGVEQKRQGGVFQVFSKYKKHVKSRIGLVYPECNDSVIIVELFSGPDTDESEVKRLVSDIEAVGAVVERVHFDN